MKLVPTALLCVALGACSREQAAAPQPERSQSAESAPSRFVVVSKPEDRSIMQAPAIVRASAAASGEVTAPTPLRIAHVYVKVGQAVAAGDRIVDVRAPELLDAAAVVLSAAARARAHEERADQLEALLGEGLALRAQVFEQRTMAADLRASRLQAIALLRSAGVDPDQASALMQDGVVTLRAPVAGIVTELSARPGRSFDPGAMPIARLTGQASARIEVQTAKGWPEATSAVFTASDGRRVVLDPSPVSSVVIPADGTTRSWFDPKDSVDLPDGLVGIAEVFAARDVWEVPAAAILQSGQQSLVLRRRADRTERVAVQVLMASGASALVRGPLEPGDRVASSFPDEPSTEGNR
ncbi:MAG: efflux RND transporter periplasmic adaptor subunit [Myxococcales bacterium]